MNASQSLASKSGDSGGAADWLAGYRSSLERWAGPAVIVVAGLIMLGWSWGTWPDVQVDFGRELYVPWQLASGKVLYKDIAYFNGPLSPYLNSIWFRLFGVSVRTLVLCNIVLLGALVWMSYRLMSEVGGRFAASVACVTFVLLLAFAQHDIIGNYNYVCPYSHEATHGMILAVFGLLCVSAYVRRGGLLAVGGAGLALGLVFLTKTEVFLASAASLVVGLAAALWLQRPSVDRAIGAIGVFIGCAAVGPLAAYGLLCSAMPGDQALSGVLGSWPHAMNKELTSLKFYRGPMGLEDPAASIGTILKWSVHYAVTFGIGAGLAMGLRKLGKQSLAVSAVVFVLVVILLGPNFRWIEWYSTPRPWPLFMLAIAVGCFVLLVRNRKEPQRAAGLVLPLTFSVFALVSLTKIVGSVAIIHYGFFLAMPAMLLVLAALFGWLPAWIKAREGQPMIFVAYALGVLAVTVYAHFFVVNIRFEEKIHPVGSGGDAILADSKGVAFQACLDEIAKRVTADETLAVFPEGVTLNYFARRVNPTPYINFMPPEMILFGEDEMLASFKANRPDFVAIMPKNTIQYGFKGFGQDYGVRLTEWIGKNYQMIKLIGDPPPYNEGRFGIMLLRRTDKG